MSARAIFGLCAQALLIQAVLSQCISRAADDAAPFAWPGFGYNGLSAWLSDRLAAWGSRGFACDGIYPSSFPIDFTPTSGGSLPVTSVSPLAPVGLSVMSENAYEGILAAAGELPFVGTAAVEGILPSVGAGAINHNCGNGLNTMTALSAFSSPASVAPIELVTPCGINAYPFGVSAPIIPTAAPACAAPALFSPAITVPSLAADIIGSPGLVAPGLLTPGIAASALAYDGFVLDAPWGIGYGCNGAIGAPLEAIEFTATSGGSLPVTSASAVPPTGLAVAAETIYEGPLLVAGELPFVGTVAVEGIVPAAGAGAVNHACGNGINAMASETTLFAPGFANAAIAPGIGYPGGWAGTGCGHVI